MSLPPAESVSRDEPETAASVEPEPRTSRPATLRDRLVINVLASLLVLLVILLGKTVTSPPVVVSGAHPQGRPAPGYQGDGATHQGPRADGTPPASAQKGRSPMGGEAAANGGPANRPAQATQTQGEPRDGGPGNTSTTLDDLPRLTSQLMALDESSTPLTVAQRALIQTAATELLTATTIMQGDLYKVIGVLSDHQLELVFQPHGGGGDPPAPQAGSGDPRINAALSTLSRKMAASGVEPHEPKGSPPTLDAAVVAESLVYLESTPDALSPEQARTVVDALTDYLKNSQKASTAQNGLLDALTPAQRMTLRSQAAAPTTATMMARCLVLWSRKQ